MPEYYLNPSGLYVALTTPINGKGNVDYLLLSQHAHQLVREGVRGFVVGGTTGEGWNLTPNSVVMGLTALKHLRDDNEGLLLVAGVIKNSEKESLAQIRSVNDVLAQGNDVADAFLLAPPIGKNYTHEQALDFYVKAAQESSVPIIAYNIPTRTGHQFTAETLVRINQETDGKVCAVKDSAPKATLSYQIGQILSDNSFPLAVFQGNDRFGYETFSTLFNAGYQGKPAAISGASSFQGFARIERQMYDALDSRDFTRALELQRLLREDAFKVLSDYERYPEQSVLKALIRATEFDSYPLAVSDGLKRVSHEDLENIVEKGREILRIGNA